MKLLSLETTNELWFKETFGGLDLNDRRQKMEHHLSTGHVLLEEQAVGTPLIKAAEFGDALAAEFLNPHEATEPYSAVLEAGDQTVDPEKIQREVLKAIASNEGRQPSASQIMEHAFMSRVLKHLFYELEECT